MKNFLLRRLAPHLAAVIAVLIIRAVPSLEGAEEAIVSAVLAVWGVVLIALSKNDADRDKLIAADQRVLRAEGVYAGSVDGKYGPKTSAGVRGLASIADHRRPNPRR